jgi:hypothetical protein
LAIEPLSPVAVGELSDSTGRSATGVGIDDLAAGRAPHSRLMGNVLQNILEQANTPWRADNKRM